MPSLTAAAEGATGLRWSRAAFGMAIDRSRGASAISTLLGADFAEMPCPPNQSPIAIAPIPQTTRNRTISRNRKRIMSHPLAARAYTGRTRRRAFECPTVSVHDRIDQRGRTVADPRRQRFRRRLLDQVQRSASLEQLAMRLAVPVAPAAQRRRGAADSNAVENHIGQPSRQRRIDDQRFEWGEWLQAKQRVDEQRNRRGVPELRGVGAR